MRKRTCICLNTCNIRWKVLMDSGAKDWGKPKISNQEGFMAEVAFDFSSLSPKRWSM